jgi:glycosyltransferase involved in cell wall biosynthesis
MIAPSSCASRAQAPSDDPRPKVLAITDMPGWAFENIAKALAHTLASHYQIEILPATQFGQMTADSLRRFAERFDAVYCFSPIMPDQAYEVLSVRPMVVGVHSEVSMDHKPHLFVPERFRRFAAVGCVNQRIADRCQRLGLHERVYVTSNGIDPERFSPPAEGHCGPMVRAGWSGAIERSEGPIKRFKELVVPACIVAGVPLLAAAREWNYIPAEQMPQYYRLIDVYLCASTTEGSQGPLVEAAASGCALISTRVGIAEQLIQHGVNGFLIEPTVEAIADRLYWSREHPEQVRQMGMAARRTTLEAWTWEHRAQQYAQLFEEGLRSAACG